MTAVVAIYLVEVALPNQQPEPTQPKTDQQSDRSIPITVNKPAPVMSPLTTKPTTVKWRKPRTWRLAPSLLASLRPETPAKPAIRARAKREHRSLRAKLKRRRRRHRARRRRAGSSRVDADALLMDADALLLAEQSH
jgi:hypothetical protein